MKLKIKMMFLMMIKLLYYNPYRLIKLKTKPMLKKQKYIEVKKTTIFKI